MVKKRGQRMGPTSKVKTRTGIAYDTPKKTFVIRKRKEKVNNKLTYNLSIFLSYPKLKRIIIIRYAFLYFIGRP